MRRFKKRVLVVCMVLCCVFGLSVESFAAPTVYSYSQLPSVIRNVLTPLPGVSNGYLVHVSTEKMSDAQRLEWEKVMTQYLNHPDYLFTIGLFSSSSTSIISVNYGELSSLEMSSSVTFMARYFQFDLNGNFLNAGLDSPRRSVVISSNGGYSWVSEPDLFLDNSAVSSSCRLLDFEAFAIDDGIEREEPEPDPPSSSSTPETPSVPYVPSGPPDFGTVNSEYLPYDTSIWEALMWYLRDIIGSAGKILLLIMFIVTIIPVIISAIKHYLGDHNDHGSGLL